MDEYQVFDLINSMQRTKESKKIIPCHVLKRDIIIKSGLTGKQINLIICTLIDSDAPIKIIDIISDFGDGETDFHTRDIERLVCENKDFKSVISNYESILEMIKKITDHPEGTCGISNKIRDLKNSNDFLRSSCHNLQDKLKQKHEDLVSTVYDQMADLKMFSTMLSYVAGGGTHNEKAFMVRQMKSILDQRIEDIKSYLYSEKDLSFDDLPF